MKITHCIFLSYHTHHNYCYVASLYILVAVTVRQLEPLPMSRGRFSHVLLNLNSEKMGVHFRSVRGFYGVVSHKGVQKKNKNNTESRVVCHVTKNFNNVTHDKNTLISSVQISLIVISKVVCDTA